MTYNWQIWEVRLNSWGKWHLSRRRKIVGELEQSDECGEVVSFHVYHKVDFQSNNHFPRNKIKGGGIDTRSIGIVDVWSIKKKSLGLDNCSCWEMYIRISLRGICKFVIISRNREVFELFETTVTPKAKHYSHIILIRSLNSFGMVITGKLAFGLPFIPVDFAASRLGFGLADDLSRFFFVTCKTFDCCFSRSLFFSQELHTNLRLYRGFGHISPFLWLHPI